MRPNEISRAMPQASREGGKAPSWLANADLRPEEDVRSSRSSVAAAVFCVFALIAIGLTGIAAALSESAASPKVESVINRSVDGVKRSGDQAGPGRQVLTPRASASSTSKKATKAPAFYQPASPEPTPTPSEGTSGLARITTTYGNETMRGGAIVLDSTGIVATNYHVVNHPSPSFSIYIPETRTQHSARLLGYSPLTDVAILKIDGAPSLKPATIASKPPKPGDPAVMFGFPDSDSRATAASGHVQTGVARNRGKTTIDNFTYDGMSFLVSCRMVPGYSGGPTVNPKTGEIIGMNARYYIDSRVEAESIAISDVTRVKAEVLSGKPTKDTVVK